MVRRSIVFPSLLIAPVMLYAQVVGGTISGTVLGSQ